MLSKHYINDVIINYTRKPLSDNFYDFNNLCKFITEYDYPFLEPFFSEKRMHIIYWNKSKTYWVMMKNGAHDIILKEIKEQIKNKHDDLENINRIIEILPCSLDCIVEKFTVTDINDLNTNRILSSSKILYVSEIQKYNIKTGYKYIPLGSNIEDDRVFVGTIIGENIVSLCSMTFPSYDTCITIGMNTEETCRYNGYATSNLILMTKYIMEKGASVHYSCKTQNIASKNTAISAGFSNVARVYQIIM